MEDQWESPLGEITPEMIEAFTKRHDNAFEQANALRGVFLGAMADVEVVVSRLLSDYYQPRDIRSFDEHVLRHMSFGRKVAVVSALARNVAAGAGPGLDTDVDDFISKISRLRDRRNTLAHQQFLLSDTSYLLDDSDFTIGHRRADGEVRQLAMTELRGWIEEARAVAEEAHNLRAWFWEHEPEEIIEGC